MRGGLLSINYIVYMAVDPGGRTGYACVGLPLQREGVISRGDVVDALIDAKLGGRLVVGQARGSRRNQAEVVAAVWRRVAEDSARRYGRCVSRKLVWESFQIRGSTMKQDLLSPVQIAERLVTMGELSTDLWEEDEPQSPSVKSTMPPERLVRFGLYEPAMPHAMDALKHLIIALRGFGK